MNQSELTRAVHGVCAEHNVIEVEESNRDGKSTSSIKSRMKAARRIEQYFDDKAYEDLELRGVNITTPTYGHPGKLNPNWNLFSLN